MVATRKRVTQQGRLLLLAAALLCLGAFLFAIPTVLNTDKAVSEAYKICNAHYQKEFKQRGLYTDFNYTFNWSGLNATES